MAIRKIITLPDPQLRMVSQPVGTIDDDTRALMDDMLETMYDAPGIGLAAIQIGVPRRIVVVDVAKPDPEAEDEEPEKDPIFLTNPEIIWSSEERATHEEGCLSIPEYYEEVERPAACKVRFLDRNGAEQEIHAEGLLSTCLQHEVDHLNGVLFIDYLSKLKRSRVTKKFAKAAKLAEKEKR